MRGKGSLEGGGWAKMLTKQRYEYKMKASRIKRKKETFQVCISICKVPIPGQSVSS